MSFTDYAANDSVSRSGIAAFLRSPAHYRVYMSTPHKDTDAFRIGRATHAYILEGKEDFVIAPDWNKNTNKYKEWKAEQGDALILSEEEREQLYGMRGSVFDHPMASMLLSDGVAEVSSFWTDIHSGESCKCRLDWIMEDHDGVWIVDLKTTENASLSDFQRSIAKYNYHLQAAFYSDGHYFASKKIVKGFVFIAVEKNPPYAVGVYILDSEAILLGQHLYKKALLDLAQCKINKQWPAYSDKAVRLSLPAWAMKE